MAVSLLHPAFVTFREAAVYPRKSPFSRHIPDRQQKISDCIPYRCFPTTRNQIPIRIRREVYYEQTTTGILIAKSTIRKVQATSSGDRNLETTKRLHTYQPVG